MFKKKETIYIVYELNLPVVWDHGFEGGQPS